MLVYQRVLYQEFGKFDVYWFGVGSISGMDLKITGLQCSCEFVLATLSGFILWGLKWEWPTDNPNQKTYSLVVEAPKESMKINWHHLLREGRRWKMRCYTFWSNNPNFQRYPKGKIQFSIRVSGNIMWSIRLQGSHVPGRCPARAATPAAWMVSECDLWKKVCPDMGYNSKGWLSGWTKTYKNH